MSGLQRNGWIHTSMMAIRGSSGQWGSWHVGEDMHVPAGQVLTFQVDEHELSWLMDAIHVKLAVEGVRVHLSAQHLTPVL